MVMLVPRARGMVMPVGMVVAVLVIMGMGMAAHR
jgi:hypothetical protein